ncbi:cell wall hydrolase [Lysinibacillus antri]|uniref:Cell wall hydrolase n=1 Tax=Lysinibacillus antri TaxID=2498145 RepID=A0A432LCL2_9BACI|nr:cell wall hydrolase [Lysinibacillus antri]
MLLVGNVGVNRVVADCLDFKNVQTLEHMVYQSSGGFEATPKEYFYQQVRPENLAFARRLIQGECFPPAKRFLRFFMPTGDCLTQ